MKDVTKENFEVSGPVKDERKKLESMLLEKFSSVEFKKELMGGAIMVITHK